MRGLIALLLMLAGLAWLVPAFAPLPDVRGYWLEADGTVTEFLSDGTLRQGHSWP